MEMEPGRSIRKAFESSDLIKLAFSTPSLAAPHSLWQEHGFIARRRV